MWEKGSGRRSFMAPLADELRPVRAQYTVRRTGSVVNVASGRHELGLTPFLAAPSEVLDTSDAPARTAGEPAGLVRTAEGALPPVDA